MVAGLRAARAVDRVILVARDVANLVHTVVHVLAGAGGVTNVAVSENVRQRDFLTVGETGVGGAFGVVDIRTLRVEIANLGAPTSEVASGVDHGLRCRGFVVVAQEGNGPGVGVETARVDALNWLVQAARVAFIDVAVFVHQGVVSHVAPAQCLCMVLVDTANNASGLGFRVVVGACCVVDGDGVGFVVVVRFGAADRLVSSPFAAGNHAGHAGCVGGVGGEGDFAFVSFAVNEYGLDAGGIDFGSRGVAKQIDAGGGDLNFLGGFHKHEFGAAAGLVIGGVNGFGVVPIAPRAVVFLGADERGDVLLAFPGQGEHGEFLVAAEFLHRAGAAGLTLGGDGGIVDDNVVAFLECFRIQRRSDGAGALFLGVEDVAALHANDGRGQQHSCEHNGHCWPTRRGVQPATL